MKKSQLAIVRAVSLVILTGLACNFPSAAQPTDLPPAGPAPESSAAPSQVQPAGTPILSLEPGSGYLFASAQVVRGADERDVWWNGATLVPSKLIASLGPVDNLSAVAQISAGAIVERQLQPVPGHAYVMETVDGQYVLLRMLSLGGAGEINLEWLYPFAGQVQP